MKHRGLAVRASVVVVLGAMALMSPKNAEARVKKCGVSYCGNQCGPSPCDVECSSSCSIDGCWSVDGGYYFARVQCDAWT